MLTYVYSTLTQLFEQMQHDFNKFKFFFYSNHFELSSKTKHIIVGHKNYAKFMHHLYIKCYSCLDNNYICAFNYLETEQVDSLKYLVVTIDRILNWRNCRTLSTVYSIDRKFIF